MNTPHYFAMLVAGFVQAACLVPPATALEERPPDRPTAVQIALLLDTSNSMDGLIAQAKTQLWQIVNQFGEARQDGKAPRVEVALYEYGNDGLSAEKGYVRQILPLTTDLDRVSESLFGLRTNGGAEYCAWAIRDAVNNLDWSSAPKAYKAIFIAGNEPFTQGPIRYRDACEAAVGRGVVVNTIHCGNEQEGVLGKWLDGARLGGGKFLTIDTDARIVRVDAPQDREIAELNARLNGTYLPYGSRGAEGKARQLAQDANAASAPAAPSVTAERSKTKASGSYSNSAWDLLDAIREKKVKVAELPKAELPPEVQAVAPEERTAYIEKKQKERDDIQARLRELGKARDEFVRSQANRAPGDKRLDQAIIGAVREQASKKSFVFEPSKAAE